MSGQRARGLARGWPGRSSPCLSRLVRLPRIPISAQLKRQAKELLKNFAAGDPSAVAEIAAHYRGANADSFALSDAQLVLARAYGFRSWPALKAFVDGDTVRRLVEAVRAGDAATVRAMAARRRGGPRGTVDAPCPASTLTLRK